MMSNDWPARNDFAALPWCNRDAKAQGFVHAVGTTVCDESVTFLQQLQLWQDVLCHEILWQRHPFQGVLGCFKSLSRWISLVQLIPVQQKILQTSSNMCPLLATIV